MRWPIQPWKCATAMVALFTNNDWQDNPEQAALIQLLVSRLQNISRLQSQQRCRRLYTARWRTEQWHWYRLGRSLRPRQRKRATAAAIPTLPVSQPIPFPSPTPTTTPRHRRILHRDFDGVTPPALPIGGLPQTPPARTHFGSPHPQS